MLTSLPSCRDPACFQSLRSNIWRRRGGNGGSAKGAEGSEDAEEDAALPTAASRSAGDPWPNEQTAPEVGGLLQQRARGGDAPDRRSGSDGAVVVVSPKPQRRATGGLWSQADAAQFAHIDTTQLTLTTENETLVSVRAARPACLLPRVPRSAFSESALGPGVCPTAGSKHLFSSSALCSAWPSRATRS